MKKLIVILIVVLLLGAGGWQVYRKISASAGGDSRRGGGDASVPVELEEIKAGMILDTRVFTGTLIPQAQFIASAKIAGKLEKLHVDIGDRIANGTLLAELDDDEYVQQFEQAKADMAVAQANMKQALSAMKIAEREFKRIEALHEKNMASESETDAARAEYDARKAGYEVASAQVTRSEASLRTAEIRLSYTLIKASWDSGEEFRIVGERFVDEGANLRANDAIVSVINIEALKGVINIIDTDYAKVTPQQSVTVMSDAFPGRTFAGTVTRIAPVLKEQSRQARVEIRIPNDERILKPGMFIRAEIEFGRFENAVIIPEAALAKREGRIGIFLVDKQAGTAVFVPLETGIRAKNRVQVLSPPDLAGYIVTLGHHILEDGGRVSFAGQAKTGPLSGSPEGDKQ